MFDKMIYRTLLLTFIWMFCLIDLTISVNIECNYSIKIKKVLDKIYNCETINNLNITSSESSIISSVTGVHEKGKSLNDVEAFSAKSKKVSNFPKGLEEIFKNLKRIRISDGRLKEICADDLIAFPLLTELSLKENDIKVVEDGTFDFNLNLKYVNFEKNKIVHFGDYVFDFLSNLELLYLSENICVKIITSNTVKEVIKTIKTSCKSNKFLELDRNLTKLEYKCRYVRPENFDKFIIQVKEFENNFNSSNFAMLTSITDRIDDLHEQKKRSFWTLKNDIRYSKKMIQELSQQKMNNMFEQNTFKKKSSSSKSEVTNLELIAKKFANRKKNSKLPNFKNVIWCVAYVTSFIGLAVYVQQAYFKLNIDPDIGINPKLISSNEVPLLALTVCSPVAIKEGFVNSLEYYLQYINFKGDSNEFVPKILSVKEKNYLAAVTQACGAYHTDYRLQNDIKGRDEKDVIKLLQSATLSPNDTFNLCVRQIEKVNCETEMKLIMTHEGFCYTNNMIDFYEIFNDDVISSDFDSYKLNSLTYQPNQWTLNKGYLTSENNIPFRAVYGSSFKLLMSINESNTDLCKDRREGFKVTYHLPNEIPTVFHDHDYIGFQRKLIVEIKPQAYSMDPMLKKFSVDKRRCYFNEERVLKFFKAYTKVNCNLECLTNFTLRTCGCVQFAMPRTQDTPVCDVDKIKCYQNAAREWPKNDPMSNTSVAPCECYPPCRDIRYEIVSKTHDLNEKNSLTLKHYQLGNNTSKIFSLIHVKYSKFQVEEMESFVVYKIQNFIAECGGLLGLFMGISFMSIVEMIIRTVERIIKKDENEKKRNQLKNSSKLIMPQRKFEYNLTHGVYMMKPATMNQKFIYGTPFKVSNLVEERPKYMH